MSARDFCQTVHDTALQGWLGRVHGEDIWTWGRGRLTLSDLRGHFNHKPESAVESGL